MRILHVGKYFPPQRGGMETFLADLVAQQRAQGDDVFVLVHGQPLEDDPEWLERVPVQVSLSYAPIALGFGLALRRAVREFEPDVLHLHLPNGAAIWALLVLKARAVPCVVHWHSDVLIPDAAGSLRVALACYRRLEHSLLAHADRIVATSPDYLSASAPLKPWRDKCVVVPLGLPPPAMAPTVAAWQPDALKLLSIGRLAHYKGFDTLIEAVAGLHGVHLKIVGEGECRAQLEAMISRLVPAQAGVRIELLGDVSEPDKQALLASCDVFCLASHLRTEAFGLVLLEAMQHGRPCLVSDLPGSGMPWLVRQTGAGWLVPLRDVPAWQAAIVACRDSPQAARARGEAGRLAQLAQFSAQACAQSLARVYVTLTGTLAPPVRSESILIVIPARDEVSTIASLVAELRGRGWHDVLVVDDQSTDDTGAAARSAGAMVVRPPLPMGAWGAIQTGLRFAVLHGYGGVLTMDADGQHETPEVPRLLAARDRADVVIGAFPERASRMRRVAWKWFRELAGFELRDLTSGFRFYGDRAMAVLAAEEATLLDYQDVGILLLLRRAGLSILEVPVTMNERTAGKSRIFSSWLNVARYMAITTLLCFARWEARTRAPRRRESSA